jgi:hypothetical protein
LDRFAQYQHYRTQEFDIALKNSIQKKWIQENTLGVSKEQANGGSF